MSEKLLPCPFCGGEATMVKMSNCGRYVQCWDCTVATEKYETDYAGSAYGKVIAAWNRRAQPENESLTLDELRGMLDRLEEECRQAGGGHEDYTNGYRWGHRNGQMELLRWMLKAREGAARATAASRKGARGNG